MIYNRQAIYGRRCFENMKDFLQNRLNGTSIEENTQQNALSTKVRKSRKKKITKKKVIIGIVILLLVFTALGKFFGGDNENNLLMQGMEETVGKQNIEVIVESNATLQPADKYSITALVKGEVLQAGFEKGDIVKEGDVLYKIDSSDMENTIKRAEISYSRVKKNHENTLELLDELNIKSKKSGTIIKLYVDEGDDITAGTKIADVKNSDVMILALPFNSNDAKNMSIGDKGTVTLNSTFETLDCIVTKIDGADTILTGNRIVRYVEVEVQNPGAMNNTTEGTAVVNNMACVASGVFEYSEEFTITSKVGGTIETLTVSQGDKVNKDQVIVILDSEDVLDQVESSQMSLDDAKLSYDNTLEKLEDYTITAPITGTVVTKNTKQGDNLDNTNGQNTLAEIYDMSYLKFDISVDELDINKMKVGQKVKITCDSLEGTFEGVVTNVSVAGTTLSGYTTYPVTVEIKEVPEGLLPGMNITAEIVVEQAQDVLAVPVSAVQRGNIVYVKDASVTTAPNKNIPVGYKEVKVETGFSNSTYIEIVSGLSEGDVIFVPYTVSSGSAIFNAMMNMSEQMNGGMSPHGNMGAGMPNRGGGF